MACQYAMHFSVDFQVRQEDAQLSSWSLRFSPWWVHWRFMMEEVAWAVCFLCLMIILSWSHTS